MKRNAIATIIAVFAIPLFLVLTCAAALGQGPAAPAAAAPAAAAPAAAAPATVEVSNGRQAVKEMLLKRSNGTVSATPIEVRQGANDALAEKPDIVGSGDVLVARAAARANLPLSAAGRDAARMADEAILKAWTSRVTGTDSKLWAYAPAVEQEAAKGGVAAVEEMILVWHEDEKVLDALENPGFFGSIWWWWYR